ncbi:hypothetical protein AX16_002390 [Volvariella volvacea WC 439]|nr:hypothetical protein AX16_002390 [Volvariella volvacea WC 439]
MSGMPIVPLPPGFIGGAIAVTVFAILSTTALLSIALRIIWLGIHHHISQSGAQPQEYAFFRTQLGTYAACLLLANTINSSAGLINIKWLADQGITEDWGCYLQAAIMQVGNWATAYFTISIAIHTLNSLVLRKRQSVLICAATIFAGWMLAITLAFIPLLRPRSDGLLYGVDGLACGIRSVYSTSQLALHLLPIFIGSIFSTVLYSGIFLVLRGTLVVRGGFKLNLGPQDHWNNNAGADYHRFVANIARSMLWYPVAYVVLLVPYSALRILIISGYAVPFEAIVFAYTCWYLLGVVNAFLFYNTFRVLGPAFEAMNGSSQVGPSDTESFGSPEKLPSYPDSPKDFLDEKIDHDRDIPSLPYRAPLKLLALAKPIAPAGRISTSLAAVESFYSYPSSPSVGRHNSTNVRPKRSLIAYPEPALNRAGGSPVGYGHTREESIGLPAPPRPNRVPVRRLSDEGSISPDSPNSWKNVDLRTPGRHPRASQHSPAVSGGFGQGSRPTQRPMLSAVNAAFGNTSSVPPLPSPARYSTATIKAPIIGPVPAGRQRTILADRPRPQEGTTEYGHVPRVPSFSG